MKSSGKTFDIIYAKGVKKDLKNISKSDLQRIKKAIEKLRNFPDISNVRHLTAHPLADFKLRVGKYSVLFDVKFSEEIIIVLKIGHRKGVY